MRLRFAMLAAAALLGACQAAPPPAAPVAAAMDPSTVTASFGVPTANRATVRFAPARTTFGLLAGPPGVHRWVAKDVLQYEVVLKEQTTDEPPAFNDVTAKTVLVPVKGPAPKAAASFANVPSGAKYRVFVTARGNAGGVVAEPFDASVMAVMNAAAATSDFDFSQTTGLPTSVTRTVDVVFDAVPFTGGAKLAITAPAEGEFDDPTGVAGEAK